jgi:hypothetical protein
MWRMSKAQALIFVALVLVHSKREHSALRPGGYVLTGKTPRPGRSFLSMDQCDRADAAWN